MQLLRDIGQFIVIWFFMGFIFMILVFFGGGLNNIPEDQIWVPFAVCWGLYGIIVGLVAIGEICKGLKKRLAK